jgi:hypothetical protein
VTRGLWKTTIVIWSEFNGMSIELSDLARDAETGESYCSFSESIFITNPLDDPHAPSQEFFQLDEEEEENT